MNTIKKPTPPKADDTWLSPSNDVTHLVADTITQEPQKGTMEEMVQKFRTTCADYVAAGELPDFEAIFEEVVHHQLQKAREEDFDEDLFRQSAWYKAEKEIIREEERERIEQIFKQYVPPHALNLEDSVWLKRLLNKAFNHNQNV